MTIALEAGVSIRGRAVGAAEPLYVVAEIGLNHAGEPDRAAALVEAAARARVAAVKLQSLRADTLVAAHCPPPAHVAAASLREFFSRFELGIDTHRALARQAHAAGVAFISSAFDEAAVDMLADVGADAIKIASGDLTHLRLIAHAARSRLPLLISTGMSDMSEVEAAVRCALEHDASALVLLHCVSAYPVPHGGENLRAISTLGRAFGIAVGLSDHSREPLSVPLAVALGASAYERHIVLERDGQAVDEPVSSTAGELAAIVELAEHTKRVLGHGRRECLPCERPNRTASRRGLYAARHIRAGDRVRPEDLSCLRPEHAMPASTWGRVVGARAMRDIAEGEALEPGVLEGTQQ